MGFYYVVQRGDNLSRLARRHGLPSWRAIYHHPRNRAAPPEGTGLQSRRPNASLIHPGDRIYIPDPGEASSGTSRGGGGRPAPGGGGATGSGPSEAEVLQRVLNGMGLSSRFPPASTLPPATAEQLARQLRHLIGQVLHRELGGSFVLGANDPVGQFRDRLLEQNPRLQNNSQAFIQQLSAWHEELGGLISGN